MLGVADRDQGVHFLDELLLLVIVEVHVPLGQSGLAGSVLNQDETDHSWLGVFVFDSSAN